VTSDQPCLRPRLRALRVTLHGVPRQCTEASFTVRITVSGGTALRRVSVLLDGRRIATSTRRSFRQRVGAREVRDGPHMLTVRARDRAAHSAVRSAVFHSC
jgi:hypothetical protein